MKIAILGSGAMGSLFGGMLSQHGAEVVLFDINKAHVDAVNGKGLLIEESSTGEQTRVHPKASTDPKSVEGSDYYIVFVKSTATEQVAKNFLPHTSRDTVVITMQNGVGNEEILRGVFGEHRTAAGVTSQGATYLGPGAIRHAGSGPTYLCMSDRNNKKLEPFLEVLNTSGFETHIEENIQDLIWSKLIINVGINALTALTGLHNGELLDYEDTKEIMKDLTDEAVAVAEANNITLTHENPLETLYEVARKTEANRSSMLQDFDRGSRTEIEFINFAIVREGEKLGIPTPVNKTLARLVRTLDNYHAKEKN
ncbi:MAG: ketopantoate reductase family protein [Spirochaetaceae bacterium]